MQKLSLSQYILRRKQANCVKAFDDALLSAPRQGKSFSTLVARFKLLIKAFL
eukprot:UN00656